MLAQRLRHKITVQQKTTVLNSYRENVGVWSHFMHVFAGVEPLSAKEMNAAGGTQSETMVRIVLRYAPTITKEMRVLWNGKIYELKGDPVHEFERGRITYLNCVEGANDGGQ